MLPRNHTNAITLKISNPISWSFETNIKIPLSIHNVPFFSIFYSQVSNQGSYRNLAIHLQSISIYNSHLNIYDIIDGIFVDVRPISSCLFNLPVISLQSHPSFHISYIIKLRCQVMV